ncbi:MASE1 domain-containing protein [Nonomuraea sp. NPDC050536]|uniref:MASE1 domain-containing protein n=1 Tax=Nonomuraea sp. NPDC050536 TaxID=3364366 RepID=UPI0037CC25C6
MRRESRVSEDTSRLRGLAVLCLQTLGVAGAYFAAAKLGLQHELVRGQVTPLWPPTGIALACLLLMGLRIWPGITLGAFLVNVPIGPTALAVVVISAGNTLAPVCSYLLLTRVGFRTTLDRLRDALALVFLGALGGMLVSATMGTGALVLSGALELDKFWPTWSVWWTGDAMGVLVCTPLLLVIRHTYRSSASVALSRWVEAVALLVGITIVTVMATSGSVNLLFLVFPFLIWAALRFELVGAVVCALLVTMIAILSAARGTGPFADHDLFTNMVTLQAFNGSAALTALLLAAVIAERNRAHRNIKQVCDRLTDVMARIEGGQSAEQQEVRNFLRGSSQSTSRTDGER